MLLLFINCCCLLGISVKVNIYKPWDPAADRSGLEMFFAGTPDSPGKYLLGVQQGR